MCFWKEYIVGHCALPSSAYLSLMSACAPVSEAEWQLGAGDKEEEEEGSEQSGREEPEEEQSI